MTLEKCIVKDCNEDLFIKKRRLCRKHYMKYYQFGLVKVSKPTRETLTQKENLDKYLSQMIQKDTESGCWIWKGDDHQGYAQGYCNGKKFRVHRLSWELFHKRPIPEATLILHTCGNKLCVNPHHLQETKGNRRDFVDLVGQQFGKLLVVRYYGKYGKLNKNYWVCLCECGKEKRVLNMDLLKGRIKGCGSYCGNKHIEFVEKLEDKHGKLEFIFHDKYLKQTDKILVEDKYGKCLVNPDTLRDSGKPSIASAINKTEYFINRAKEIYGDKYSYEKSEYKGMNKYVLIGCPQHGSFFKLPSEHIGSHKSGCPECGIKKRGNRTSGSERKGGVPPKTD